MFDLFISFFLDLLSFDFFIVLCVTIFAVSIICLIKEITKT